MILAPMERTDSQAAFMGGCACIQIHAFSSTESFEKVLWSVSNVYAGLAGTQKDFGEK